MGKRSQATAVAVEKPRRSRPARASATSSPPHSSPAIPPAPLHVAPVRPAAKAGSLAVRSGVTAVRRQRAWGVVDRGLRLGKTLPDEYGVRLAAAREVLDRAEPKPKPIELSGPTPLASMTIKLEFGDGRPVRQADYELQPGADYDPAEDE